VAITKSKLAEAVSHKSELSSSEAISVVESLLEIIKKTLASGENLMVSGFGKFSIKEKKKRRGRNPQTGNALILDARRIVTFKCSGNLRDALNGSEEK
jgi:integration host factor subunit alpha